MTNKNDENKLKINNEGPPPLPIGWTQVRRKRKASTENIHNDDECDDNTGNCFCNIPKTLFHEFNPIDSSNSTTYNKKGYAIFCLHSFDSKWFQGYFFPQDDNGNNESILSGKKTALGLLVDIRQDVDECLQCASDGGYKELDVTIIQFRTKKKYKVSNVVCTGGDMMSMKTPVGASQTLQFIEDSSSTLSENDSIKIDFEADQVLTDNKIEPYILKYFRSLLKHVDNQDGNNNSNTINVLEKLPDCAIVIGKMNLFGYKNIFTL